MADEFVLGRSVQTAFGGAAPITDFPFAGGSIIPLDPQFADPAGQVAFTIRSGLGRAAGAAFNVIRPGVAPGQLLEFGVPDPSGILTPEQLSLVTARGGSLAEARIAATEVLQMPLGEFATSPTDITRAAPAILPADFNPESLSLVSVFSLADEVAARGQIEGGPPFNTLAEGVAAIGERAVQAARAGALSGDTIVTGRVIGNETFAQTGELTQLPARPTARREVGLGISPLDLMSRSTAGGFRAGVN